MTPLALFSSLAWQRGGLWSYLIARSHNRASLKVEREWARGGRGSLAVLPSRALLTESGGASRHRLIRMPGSPADAPQAALQAAEPSEP